MHQVDLKVTFSSEWSRVQSHIHEIFKPSLRGANRTSCSWARHREVVEVEVGDQNLRFWCWLCNWHCSAESGELLQVSWPVFSDGLSGLFQLRSRAVFVFQWRTGVQRGLLDWSLQGCGNGETGARYQVGEQLSGVWWWLWILGIEEEKQKGFRRMENLVSDKMGDYILDTTEYKENCTCFY